MHYVGIDCGRHSVKAVGTGYPIIYPAEVGTARTLRLDGPQNYRVSLDGREWFVGPLAAESHDGGALATESKLHDATKVLFLTAAALLYQGEPLAISTCLPVSQHTNEQKQALARLVCGKHRLAVNGRPVEFGIDAIWVFPEGAAAYWDAVLDDWAQPIDKSLIDRPVVRVLDLGSRQMNAITIKQGRYVDRLSTSLPYGCYELERAGNDHEQLARRVVGDLSRLWPDQQASDLIFLCGGGALLMEDALQRHFANVLVSKNPVAANARGARKLGVRFGATGTAGMVRPA